MGVMQLLRRRDVALLLVGYGLSAFGDVLALVALTIRVHDLTGTGIAVAGLLLAGTVPMILLAPLTGLLVDRVETTRVLALGALAQTAAAGVLAFTTSVPAILALTALLGAGAALTRPAVFALLPRVAGEHRLIQANSLLEIFQFGGAALGPLAAGLLAAGYGTRVALLADAATFLVLAAAAAALHTRRPPTALAAGARPSGELRRGLAFMTGDRLLLLALVVVWSLILVVAMGNVAEVFLAKDVLGAGDLGYGVLNAAWAAGMVAGVLLVARRLPAVRLAPVLIGAAAVTGLAVVMTGAAPGIVVAVAAYVVGGGANGVENVTMRSLIQHRVPDGLRGRAYAAYAAVASSADLASTGLGGVLVGLLGARGTLIGSGAAALMIAGLGAAAYRRLPVAALR
jgi:MFS family permease